MLVLTGGAVLTSISPPRVARTDVVLAGDRILDLAPGAASGTARIDCSGCLVIPGNVCAHHHLYSALARGMPYALDPPTNFTQILQRVWWRLDRALDLESVWLSAWAGGADALLSGTTTIVDHHASPNAVQGSLREVASGLQHLGARSVLCYEVTDRDGQDRAQAGIEENRSFLKGCANGSPLTRAMVGVHASFTSSDPTLAGCVEVAREFDAGIHIHVAEDGVDQRDAVARFGKRVVERLAEADVLGARALLAHCIHLDDAEIELVRSSGATAVHNPRSNMNNGVGYARVRDLDRLALGTDGIDGDMFAESRAAFWRARESGLDIGPQWALDRLAESARFAGALFGEPLLGRIEPGAPADLAVLEYEPHTPLGEEKLAGHWMFGLSGRNVRDVLVNGEQVVRDRRLVRGDEPALRERCREAADRLWRRMEEIGPHPFEPAGAGISAAPEGS